jgi:FPC/CPF motif-containing protein YcgG
MSKLTESQFAIPPFDPSSRATDLRSTEVKLRLALAKDPSTAPATENLADEMLAKTFRDFIEDQGFPCVGAKAALSRRQMEIVIARDLTSTWDDLRVYPLLRAFAQRYRADPVPFQSFAVLFNGPTTLTEQEFEFHLWARLQSLSRKDQWLGHSPDARVSDDPSDPHFSLSFGDEAFFVVGLHPKASRPARRFIAPALVFNLHAQFETLRQSGLYEKLRETILKRDEAIAGSTNPMLTRFGEASEAKQYSGRSVPNDWVCPFEGREVESRTHDS